MPYFVEVDWTSDDEALFRIGTSLVGSLTDVLGGAFDASWSGPYDDVTAYVESFSVNRGRESTLGAMRAGAAEITLVDPTGIFNPYNSGASPITVKPMRPVRIRYVDDSATSWPIFWGWLRRVEYDAAPEQKRARLECIDSFELLDRTNPVIASTGSTNVGSVLGAICDETDGWIPAGSRSFDNGSDLPDFSSDGSSGALSLIDGILTVDLGTFFIDSGGTATYRDRWDRITRTSSGTVSDLFSGMKPTTDLDQVVNKQQVTRTGGEAQTYSGTASQAAFGVRAGAEIETGYLYSDGQALGLATRIVELQEQPISSIERVEMIAKADAASESGHFQHAYQRDIGDIVTISDVTAGVVESDYVIEAVTHQVGLGEVHRWSWTLSALRPELYDLDPFIVGTSKIGSADTFVY